MARLTELRRFLCVAVAAVSVFGGPASVAEPLRLVTDFYNGPYKHLEDDKAPGFNVEVIEQVFAAMGKGVSFEAFPNYRAWKMISRGERDGMLRSPRNSERRRICLFPDEPLASEKWMFFVRKADLEKLKFESFDNLIGHNVAVWLPTTGVFDQPILPPGLWQFLRAHHIGVGTNSTTQSLRMLAAGHVDYVVANLSSTMQYIDKLELNDDIVPLPSHFEVEGGLYVCFTKARVDPAFVDAFSQALKQFKQTDAYQTIYRKYFPQQ